MNLQLPQGKGRDFCLNSDARLNAAHGSVRSSKSVSASLRFLHFVVQRPKGQNILMVGRTLGSLERNVLHDIQRWVGAQNFDLKRGRKTVTIYGRELWLEGAYNEQSSDRIEGETLGGLYIDELTLIPENFWDMAYSRLSEPGSQAFVTMNPAGPYHYFKKKWLDREAKHDMKSWHFTLKDNLFLDPAYIKEIENSYSGLWRKRYILGLWVAAEGAVYDLFDHDRHVVPRRPGGKARSLVVGVDYGQTHPTAYVRVERIGDVWYVTDEFTATDRTNARLAKDLEGFIGGKFPQAVLIDPSAKSFRLEATAAGISRVRNADNAVSDGIARISNALDTGRLKICANCTELLEEIESYSWDPKASERGVDAVIKKDDDLLDALRYVGNHIFKR